VRKGKTKRTVVSLSFTLGDRRVRISDVEGYRCDQCKAVDVGAKEFDRAQDLARLKAAQKKAA